MTCVKFSTACLALLLTACASPKAIPESALLPCQHPLVDVTTNGGLAKGIVAYKFALDQCNVDKATVKEALDG